VATGSPLDRLDPGRFPFDPFDPERAPDPVEEDHVHRLAIRAAMVGADSYRLTRAALRRDEAILRVGNRFVPLAKFREIGFVAVGRASVSQALAVVDALGEAVTQGYIVGPVPLPTEVPFRWLEKPCEGPGHPVAAEAGAAVRELAEGLGPKDLLLVLISAGALGYLAQPPHGDSPSSWRERLDGYRRAGATGQEIDAIARVTGTGPIGGRLAAGLTCEVATFVVDRGSGPVLLGGGPTIPVAPEERTAVRAVLDRLGSAEDRTAAARGALAPDPSRPLTLSENVHRPVVIVEPPDALREGSDALGEKRWICRLAELENRLPPSAAADRFLARTDALVAEIGEAAFLQESRGLVVFGPLTFDLPEGVDDRPAVTEFLVRTAALLRRREMTVAAVATGGGPRADAMPPGGVVGSKGGATIRTIRMRQGITDVGIIATAALPRQRAR
jgi:Domain of unknown function (DUF4147)